MRLISRLSGLSGCLLFLAVARPMFECHGQNTTETSSSKGNSSEIDFETLSLLGVSHELAEEFRINLIKAIEVAKEEAQPLRQNGAGGGATEEEGEDEEDQAPTTQGPGAFGILSGIFGIFSGFGTLNPSRIVQSTVNFFPPSRRMMAQMIVDSLIGYVPPENRTARPRPRTRKPGSGSTTEMVITDAMLQEVTNSSMSKTNTSSGVIPKGGENKNGTEKMASANGTIDSAAMSEIVAPPTEATITEPEGFINVHELLARSTTPPPIQDEDDEDDVVKRVYGTDKLKTNSSMAIYKIKAKSPVEDIETRGVAEEETKVTSENYVATTPTSSSAPAV